MDGASTSAPRFAVCVCGDTRGFSAIAWALERRLIHTTSGRVDLFFHLWSDGSPLEAEGVAAARRLPGVVSVVVEPTEQRANLTALTYGWSSNRRMSASGSFEAFRSQWRKVHLCFEQAFAHARYDAYVRTRADTLHLIGYDLAGGHRNMIARAELFTGRSEYVATQACLTPWPLAVPDVWFVATPDAARKLAALPTQEEPPCCERWVEHRLLGMGVREPTERADAEHPAVCRRERTLPVLPPSGGPGPLLLLSRLHAMHLGARCFLEKTQRKKRLPADHPSCVASGDAASPPALGAAIALRDGSSGGEEALRRLILLNGTTSMDVLSVLTRTVRRTACRCARGAASRQGRNVS